MSFENLYNNVLNNIHSGDLANAKVLVEKLYSNYSNNFDVICLAAGIEASLANYHAAIDLYSLALTKTNVKAAMLDVQLNLAKCFELISEFSKAASCYSSMIEVKPNQSEWWFGLAQNELVLGNTNAAERAYRKVISHSNITQQGLIRSYAFYALSQGNSDFHELAETITQELEKCTTARVVANMHFAMANIYEQENRFDNAFESLRAANNTILKSIPLYNHRETITQAEKVIDAFRNDFELKMNTESRTKNKEEAAPIFVVGLPRSGSTLVESVLSCAPNSKALGEVGYMNSVINKARSLSLENHYPELLAKLSSEVKSQLASRYLELTEVDTGVRTIDKFLANFWNVGLILAIFPNAKIIACEKSAMDACFSLYRQNFYEGHPYSYSLQDCADYYSIYKMLIGFWEEIFANQVYRVSYESFVTDTESECVRLFKFCQLDWSKAYLETFVNRDSVKTASAAQVREPINSRSIDRWKNYRAHLTALSARLLEDT